MILSCNICATCACVELQRKPLKFHLKISHSQLTDVGFNWTHIYDPLDLDIVTVFEKVPRVCTDVNVYLRNNLTSIKSMIKRKTRQILST